MTASSTHPRYVSLHMRERLEEGVRNGITSRNGLIAHGRGEAFDYLLGEKTHDFAKRAILKAASILRNAKHPVISVNGNTAALVPDELIKLANVLNAPLEVNLFHPSHIRMHAIKKWLVEHHAKTVLLPSQKTTIAYLDSPRKYVHPEGIYKADVVFVPLEDGDRTEALVKTGKTVITVDLNPLSRTSQKATVTIVDNIVRVMPLLIEAIEKKPKTKRMRFPNSEVLSEAVRMIRYDFLRAKRFAS